MAAENPNGDSRGDGRVGEWESSARHDGNEGRKGREGGETGEWMDGHAIAYSVRPHISQTCCHLKQRVEQSSS